MERWQELIAEVAADEDWLRRLAVEVSDAIHRDVPGLRDDSELLAATRDSVEDNMELFLAMAGRGLPAERAEPRTMAVEYVRLLVHRGLGPEVLGQAYRVAHGVFWRAWAQRLRGALDRDELATALERSSAYIFAFIDALTAQVVRLHAEERAQWVRSADAVRRDTVRALVDGLPVDVRGAEQRLRYLLGREHLAFVVWSDSRGPRRRPGADDLEAEALRLVAPLGGRPPLLVTLERGVATGWLGSHDGWTADALAGLRLTGPGAGHLLAAFGAPAAGVEGFRRSHREAVQARRVAQLARAEPGTVTWYADVAVTALASADLEAARDFVAGQLGPLVDGDARVPLAATLRAYLDAGSSLRETARRLGVHENTVANRVARAESLLGRPVGERRTELALALALLDVTGG